MVNEVLLYIGSGIIILWGLSHIFATWSVVRGFGELTPKNRRIIKMAWLADGLALMFIGVLVVLVTLYYYDSTNATSQLVYRVCAGMLALMAILTLLTGARTPIIPMKICPAVKILAATFLILGSAL